MWVDAFGDDAREHQFVDKESDDFLEWEEVYKGTCYGTLKSEVERILNLGTNVIFDVDVVGGLNIKKYYGDEAKILLETDLDIHGRDFTGRLCC